MSRQSRRRQLKSIQFPVTVRQAQKLTDSHYAAIAKAIGLGNASKEEVRLALDRMAQTPDFVIEEQEYDYDEKEETEQAGANSPSADDAHQPTAENREEGESRPKGTDEVAPQSDDPSEDADTHGGDGSSREVDSLAQTSSQEKHRSQAQESQDSNGNGTGEGDPQDGGNQGNHSDRRAGDAPQPSRSETGSGNGSTSEDGGQGGTAQSSTQQAEISPSTALGDEDSQWESDRDAEKNIAPANQDQPRDAGRLDVPDAPEQSGEGDRVSDDSGVGFDADTEAIETGVKPNQGQTGSPEDSESWDGNISNSETDQLPDDRPTHQKKWGKKFGKAEQAKLSASANANHGGATAQLKGFGIDAKLLKLCRQRLAALIGDSSQDYSPRRDYAELCVRLQTYRNPQPARKEESGRPAILVMADISGSCASFSDQSVAVAKAASSLGVQGADILVLSHSNGYPYELEHNGKEVSVEAIAARSGYEHAHDNAAWYAALLNRYQIEVAIALGDWDASDDYVRIAEHPTIQRFIWLDNNHCSTRGTVKNRTKYALSVIQKRRLSKDASSIRHKLFYKDNCKNAIAFINNIK